MMNCKKCIHYKVCLDLVYSVEQLPYDCCSLYEEQKHGHWVLSRDGTQIKCSSCKIIEDLNDKKIDDNRFCPHCGAKMEELEELDEVVK